MKGPGLKYEMEVRRLWRCSKCGAERRLSGNTTSVPCRCAADKFMQLVDEPKFNRPTNREVDVYVTPEEILGDESDSPDVTPGDADTSADSSSVVAESSSVPSLAEVLDRETAVNPASEQKSSPPRADKETTISKDAANASVESRKRADKAASVDPRDSDDSEFGVDASGHSIIEPSTGPDSSTTPENAESKPKSPRRRRGRGKRPPQAGGSGS